MSTKLKLAKKTKIHLKRAVHVSLWLYGKGVQAGQGQDNAGKQTLNSTELGMDVYQDLKHKRTRIVARSVSAARRCKVFLQKRQETKRIGERAIYLNQYHIKGQSDIRKRLHIQAEQDVQKSLQIERAEEKIPIPFQTKTRMQKESMAKGAGKRSGITVSKELSANERRQEVLKKHHLKTRQHQKEKRIGHIQQQNKKKSKVADRADTLKRKNQLAEKNSPSEKKKNSKKKSSQGKGKLLLRMLVDRAKEHVGSLQNPQTSDPGEGTGTGRFLLSLSSKFLFAPVLVFLLFFILVIGVIACIFMIIGAVILFFSSLFSGEDPNSAYQYLQPKYTQFAERIDADQEKGYEIIFHKEHQTEVSLDNINDILIVFASEVMKNSENTYIDQDNKVTLLADTDKKKKILDRLFSEFNICESATEKKIVKEGDVLGKYSANLYEVPEKDKRMGKVAFDGTCNLTNQKDAKKSLCVEQISLQAGEEKLRLIPCDNVKINLKNKTYHTLYGNMKLNSTGTITSILNPRKYQMEIYLTASGVKKYRKSVQGKELPVIADKISKDNLYEMKIVQSIDTITQLTLKEWLRLHPVSEKQKKWIDELSQFITNVEDEQPLPPLNPSDFSETGNMVAALASTKVGCAYDQNRRMQEKPDVYDCSSFVWRIYKEVTGGKVLLGGDGAPVAASQAQWCAAHGKEISPSNLKPGDLIYYERAEASGRWKSVGHVAMYIGNQKMIHAKGKAYGVVVTPLDTSNVVLYARPYS